MNVGILGGTFDPIHIGHLIIAEEVRLCLELDHVLFLPAGQPWLKVERVISEVKHRVAMINLAIASNPYFKLSNIEVDRPGSSYTVDTVEILHKQLDSDTKIFLILGWDSLNELPFWKEPGQLINMCKLVVVPRLDYPKPDLESLSGVVPGVVTNTIMLDILSIDISSTEIRQRVAKGISIRYLVPREVEKYIVEHKLYRQ